MKEFKNKVAVITGAANGIGKELAYESARREMKVVLVDIDETNLKKVEQELSDMGTQVLSITADVTLYENVERVKDETLNKFGQVDLLFNNAGVVVSGPVWEMPTKEWDYITASNIHSVIYGMKAFIPVMMEQGTDCHIVNTASVAGLLSTPGMPAYHMSKFANVGLTEATNHQLRAMNSNIKMSVYCPGFIQTDLHNCDDRRPQRFAIDPDEPYYQSTSYMLGREKARYVIETGIPSDSVGLAVFTAIEEERFYILTHPQYNSVIGKRIKDMLEGIEPDPSMFIR
ncbi:SDR family NAD(P)-dependent oxidoreductase [Natranaerobius thermophilus]|uniref:Short-chain dehydrogenase/reductase SDR n=1 Tax=Natranaerobius thermophilus (strain ATCC BAA-1301 / DSM 18059 / JW/NM-WN-LF) TaxID=457570 RepID=B2A0W5_NATTJ|nr:SDR family NAD(P)-dependent oxidoreductase [Natranaerobius thermophilus]ACB85995.1 short-chain dehydrogenase/reductase SDR [Natranaerobius thermophilus JW/NM-WN-LF]